MSVEDIDPAAWQADCELVVLALLNLLRATGRRASAAAVVVMVRELTRAPDEPPGEKTSLVTRLASEFLRGGSSHGPRQRERDREGLHAAAARVAGMGAAERALFEASVVGVILGWEMGV